MLRVYQAVRRDQIEGGMSGQYKELIVSKYNGLADRQDITSNGETIGKQTIVIGGQTLIV
jgi:hypothetical protein